MVGGDWAEGWQYGPLSVLEYAVAARALSENGAPQPEMAAWTDTLAVRYAYATLPDLSGQWVGGDFDDTAVYQAPNGNEVDAVLAGLSSDAAASFAAFMKGAQSLSPAGYFYNALAELRTVAPIDFRAQSPAPPLWYVARGTRAVYARSSWKADALWSVFSSAPAVVDDHEHYSASNFVLSRGPDALIVDPSEYGEVDTLATNAVTADATVAQGDYLRTQTPWSTAELVWARGTDDAVYAARSDFAAAFNYASMPSDIAYAHREWVMLPEGEIVTIDRVQTADAAHAMYVGFHTNTGGGNLKLGGSVATGDVGASSLAIHAVLLSGGTPQVTQPEMGDCSISCSFPCGLCDAARFPVDKYAVKVPGPWAVAVHAIDALPKGAVPAVVSSLGDDAIDPLPKQNGGVLGAAVYSSQRQTYVVASSAVLGASPATMTYGVPGGSASRHVVFDAPEDGSGNSVVTASAKGGRCVIAIEAGKGFVGHPLMFSIASAADGCQAKESTAVPPGGPPPSMEGTGGGGSGGSGAGGKSGCGCRTAGGDDSPWGATVATLWTAGMALRRRSRRIIMRYAHTSRRWTLSMLALLFALAGCGKAPEHPLSGSGGGDAGVETHPGSPAITSFTATPASLPQGGGSATLSWTVDSATSLSLDQGIGTVTGASRSVSLTATTAYTLTATNASGKSTATAIVTVGTAAGVNPPGGARYVAMIAPVDGETFVGSAVDLRFVGVGRDESNYMTSTGPGGGLLQAASVQFFVDGASVLTVDAADSEYWVFKGYVKGLSLSPGDHTVFARAFYSANPGPVGQADSRPVTINVQAAPAYGQTIDMSGDLTLAGAASWVGTAASRVRVNGNGHRIYDPGSSTAVNWQFVDFYDMGDPTSTSANGIDVTTTGDVAIQSCRFDSSNPVGLSIGGTATADIRGNLFRSNMRQPLGQAPYGSSFPALQITGGSTGAKTLAGNNVGAGWVDFQAVSNWTVGGDTDADSNVLVGPRAGIFFDYQGTGTSSNIVVRRNYSDHIYYGGWSQGSNLEAGGSPSLLAEDNVLISSSWTVRGMAGEFRYNLVLLAGEDWMWLDTGANVHHNVFAGGDNNRSGLYNVYDNTTIRIQNNTFDGLGGTGSGINAIFVTGSETVTSNLFMNLPYTSVDLQSGTLQADYNLFWQCASPVYSDSRAPAHDVHADPLLTSPPVYQFELDEKAVWQRTQKVHDILSAYRTKYAPKAASPAIDSGDPTIFGAGNDIGAIGNGATNAADLFGK